MYSSKPVGKVIRNYRFSPEAIIEPPPDLLEEPGATGPADESRATPDLAALLAQAKADADRCLREAQAQAVDVRRRAEAEGFQAGLDAGQQEGLARVQERSAAEIARLVQAADSMVAERQRLLAEAESDLVDLALAIARKVIGDLAAGQAGVILTLAQRAAETLSHPGVYQLHLNPQDAELLAGELPPSNGVQTWQIVPDERVAPGGCTVTCGATLVDARPATQLAIIQRVLVEQ